MNTTIYCLSYFAKFFLEWEMFQTKVVEKNKTHTLYSVTFPPPPKKRAVYEITWKNSLQSRTGHRWQYGACALHARMTMATNTHSENVGLIFIAFPQQQWLRERASMLSYAYVVSCLLTDCRVLTNSEMTNCRYTKNQLSGRLLRN